MQTERIEFEAVQVGDMLPSLTKDPVTQVQLVKYAGASGDFNPLHTVDAVGKEAGFGGVIAHGMLIMGFVGEAVCRWVERRDLRKLSVRFQAPTFPGEQITVTGRVADKRQENGKNVLVGEVSASNQEEEVKLQGSFEAEVPAGS